MPTITLFGLDIGKHSFHLIGQDANGPPFKRQFTRSSLIQYLAQHPVCRSVMEACCGPHWLWSGRVRQVTGRPDRGPGYRRCLAGSHRDNP